MSEIADAIRALSESKGIGIDSVKQTVESMIKAAYKQRYGHDDNCIVKISDDLADISVYSRKTIVDGVYDPSQEIELEEAREYSADCAEGDEIDIKIDPQEFSRKAISTGKMIAHQKLNESFKDTLLSEYKGKVGQIIIGYYQRESKGAIYVDLGKPGRVEGYLPEKFQNPGEIFEKSDRIKALVKDIKPIQSGIQLTLSRTDPKFVEKIMELEVPEIADNTVSIYKIVREPGYRTKIAVYSNKSDVDPVGACVGLKGVRIQNIIKELNSEKIDVLKYEEDPHEFIKNALSPAEVKQVVIRDANAKMALAIVPNSQLSVAIGKFGHNSRLANKLCDWTIDVKSEDAVQDMDLSETNVRRAAEQLFSENTSDEPEYVTTVAQLPDVDQEVARKLASNGIEDIEDFLAAVENESIYAIQGISRENIEAINDIINDSVEFAEEEDDGTVEEEVEYFCPECGEKITLNMTHCPKCGTELVFEEE